MNGNGVVAKVRLDVLGHAKLSLRIFVAGKATLTAVYSGDSNFAASSQSIDVQVA